MIEATLKEIGLEANEIKIYLFLLEKGSSLAGDIAKGTRIHRRTVYDALEKLIDKGLASYMIKSGRKYFQAAPTERILSYLEEKRDKIQEEISNVKKITPELNALKRSKKESVNAEIFSGIEGLKTVMGIILKEKKDWLTIGGTGKGSIVLPYYLPQYFRNLKKSGIKRKYLAANTKWAKDWAKELEKRGLATYKILPKAIKNPQTIWIFGDKTAIILVQIKYPIIFLINNREIAQSFRDYFNWLWKVAKT